MLANTYRGLETGRGTHDLKPWRRVRSDARDRLPETLTWRRGQSCAAHQWPWTRRSVPGGPRTRSFSARSPKPASFFVSQNALNGLQELLGVLVVPRALVVVDHAV